MEESTTIDDESRTRSSTVENDGSSDDDTSQSDTELMVTSRARRATAGNRYSTLVAQEEAQEEEDEEDEVAMLFAEGEGEDEDFNSDDGDDDADMSSSDDDDQGPNVAAEDMEGEKELDKEAKVERAKKRKADLALTTVSGIRKKPKIDPTSLRRAPAPKPSKRKERVSWLPESDIAPGRTSLRKQTILHRAETHAKLKENEEQRLKMKAKREKRVKEREATAPKQMTQADRLAEAERVERRNAKSLNRWEATEKKRAEEQAAKLAALKERKLEGAVVTWYSSSAKYLGLKENRDTEGDAPPEAKKRGRKPKALLEQLAAAKLASSQPPVLAPKQDLAATASPAPNAGPQLIPPSSTSTLPPINPAHPASSESQSVIAASQPASQANKPRPGTEAEPTQSSETSFLTGIHEYASMPNEVKSRDQPTETEADRANATVDVQMGNSGEHIPSTQDVTSRQTIEDEKPSPLADDKSETDSGAREPPQHVQHSTSDLLLLKQGSENDPPVIVRDGSQTIRSDDTRIMIENDSQMTTESPIPESDNKVVQESKPATKAFDVGQVPPRDSGSTTDIIAKVESVQSPVTPAANDTGSNSTSVPPSEPPIEVISTRNLVILEKFDDLPDQSRHDFGLFYNNRKSAKPVKHSQELCPVTGLPARYRDPCTGIAYANAAAYKKLQELRKHQFAWSSMLGCYVGRTNVVARGVPDGFLGS